MSKKIFIWKEIWKIIKEHMFICGEIIEDNKDKIKILIELGKIKDMNKDKVTLNKLFEIIVEFKEETKNNFAKVNKRIDSLENRITNIEREAKKHGWDL